MAVVGSAYVEIHALTKGISDEIRDGLSKAIKGEGEKTGKTYGDEFSDSSSRTITDSAKKVSDQVTKTWTIAGTDAGKGFAAKFQDLINPISKAVITPTVDTSRIENDITRVQNRLEALRKAKTSTTIDLEIDAANAKLKNYEARLEELRKKPTSSKVEADIAAAEASIAQVTARLARLAQEKANPKVDVDIADAELRLSALQARLRAASETKTEIRVGFNEGDFTDSINKIALLGRSLAALAMPAAIIAATPQVASLGAAAVTASGSLYLIPAAATAAAAGVTTLTLGFTGLADALGPTGTPAQMKKVNEALARMAPAGREVVAMLRDMGGDWHDLRLDVQQEMLQGLAGILGEIGGQYLPILNTALVTIAGAFNTAAKEYGAFLLEPKTVTDYAVGMSFVTTALRNLTGVVEPLARAFNDMFVVGASYLPGFAQSVTDAAERFAAFIDAARYSGELNTMIEEGVSVLGELGSIAGSSGGILKSVFDASTASGANIVGVTAQLTEVVNEFLNTAQGEAALVAIFTAINDVVAGLTPAIIVLGEAVAKGIIALGPQLGPLAKAFADIIISVAPLVTDLAYLAAMVLPPLTAALSVIAPVMGPIAAGFLAIYTQAKLMALTTTIIAGMAPALAVLRAAWIAFTMSFVAGPGLFAALGAAMATLPITWIIAAIAALVAGVIFAYNHIEGFRNVVDAVFSFVVDVVSNVVNFFTGPFKDGVVNAVTAVIDFFVNFPTHIQNALSTLGGIIASTASAAWNWLLTAAQDAGAATLNFLVNFPNNVAYALGSLFGFLALSAIDGWNGFVTGITTAVAATIVFFTELPGRFVAGMTQLGAFLSKTATDGATAFREAAINGFVAVVTFFTELPGRIVSFLTTLGPLLLGAAVAAWTGFTTGIENGWNATVAFFVGLPAAIQNFFSNAGTWLVTSGRDIITGLINGLTAAGDAVVAWIVGLADSFMQGFKDAMGIASPSTVFAQFGTWILEGLINGLNAMVAGVIAVITAVGQAILGAFQTALDFLGSLWSTFWNSLNAVTGNAFAGIQAIIEYAFQLIMLVVQAFIALFQGDWDGFWLRIHAAAAGSLALIQAIFSAAWTGIQTVAITIWNAISAFFTGAFNAFSAFFSTIWNAISAVFSAVWLAIQAIATSVWNAISSFFTGAFNAYSAFFTSIWTNVLTFFTNTWNSLSAFAQSIWNAISSFYTGAFNAYVAFFSGIWQAVLDFFTERWNNIQANATAIWNAIASFFTAALSTYRAAWETMWNAISTFFTTIWTNIRTMVTTAWNNIQTFFTGALSTFKGAWDSFWSGISTGFQNIWNGISAIAESAWQGINNMFRGGINLVIDAVNWPIEKINGALGISIPTIARLATGGTTDQEGRVSGIGSTTSDAVLTRLSREEHVWSAAEVRAAGGHDAVRRMRAQVMSGYSPDARPGDLSNAMATNRVDPNSLGGRSVSEGLRRRQLMDKFPKLDDAGRAMLAYGGVQPHVAAAGDAVVAALGPMPGGIGGVGARGNVSDHPSGLALDFMTMGNVGLGDRVASMLQGQAAQFAVKYLIWQQAINEGGGWSAMEDRGSATANHMDHVHASFLGDPSAGGAFTGGGLFDPGAAFDAAAAALGLPETSRQFTRGIMPDAPDWLEPMGVSFHDKGWDGMRAAAIKLLEQISTLGGLLGGNAVGTNTGPVADQVRAVAAQYGWDSGPEWDALSAIIQKESSWNPAAANPTSSARGLFQKMTSLHGPVEPTAGGQAQWGIGYIKDRYGTPSAALAHHNRVGSYDKGGWLKPGITQAINGTGKPEAIIADPMTTFERSFKNVFKWFTPEVVDAISDSWKGASNWLRNLIDRYTPRETPSTESPTVPPIVIPPVVIPPLELPPVVVPSVPKGDFGATFNEVLSRLAPELSFAIQSGNAGQIDSFAREIANNPERISAISAAMTDALGAPVTNISTVLADLIASVKPAPVVTAPVYTAPRGPDAATPTDNRWLMSQFTRFQTAIAGKTRIGSDAGQELKAIPNLAADLYKMFPALKAATESSKIDVNKTLSSMSTELLAYLSTKSQEDASKLLSALSGDNAVGYSREGNTVRTTDQILKSASDTMAPAPAPAPAPQVTISDGAFQVTIAGNADQVTLDQLQQKLNEFGEEIVRQYEGRT